jgi:hypothetical protein
LKIYDYAKAQNKFAETERKYQIAETDGKAKYQILQKRKTKYHFKKFFGALRKLCSGLSLVP